jgi:hypothetical protein
VSDIGDDWALYAVHRQRLTSALLACASKNGGRLCILGAGKCNDVDLEQLAERFSEIHLVDIDPPALASAVARQSPAVRARLRPHVPVDLSGMSSKRLSKWHRKPPTRAELEAFEATTLASIVSRLPGPFEVVASACILTQLSFSLRQGLGESHPMLAALRLSVMTTHLRVLLELTKPGGTCLFASDVVSSTSYPLDALESERDLLEVVREIEASGASYFSADPKRIRGALLYTELAELATEPLELSPWLWTGPLARTYLVYALRFSRRA